MSDRRIIEKEGGFRDAVELHGTVHFERFHPTKVTIFVRIA